MRFKAQYKNRTDFMDEYWRSVDGDSLSEAQALAKKLARKGFILSLIVHDVDFNN